jgi:hypothetical protein
MTGVRVHERHERRDANANDGQQHLTRFAKNEMRRDNKTEEERKHV